MPDLSWLSLVLFTLLQKINDTLY